MDSSTSVCRRCGVGQKNATRRKRHGACFHRILAPDRDATRTSAVDVHPLERYRTAEQMKQSLLFNDEVVVSFVVFLSLPPTFVQDLIYAFGRLGSYGAR